MGRKRYYSNEFVNNEFSSDIWSAPITDSKDVLQKTLESFKLEGRVIKEFNFISFAYNLSVDMIEDEAYRFLDGLPEEERQNQSNYLNMNSSVEITRYAQLDDPFMIKFEDGDTFESYSPNEPYYRLSMNCIPWYINDNQSANRKNADANVLFDICIGKRIESFEIFTYETDEEPMFPGCKFPDGRVKELVSHVTLWLDNGLGISFAPNIDYFDVWITDKENKSVSITFGELHKGLFNYEDLHVDQELDFNSSSGTFFFGEHGRNYIESPYYTITTTSKKYKMYLQEDDAMLFDLAMTVFLKQICDIYDYYELSYEEWNKVLKNAEMLLDFKKFDEFFDYMINVNREVEGDGDLLYYLNNCGAEYWQKKDLHKRELQDLKEWSKIVVSDKESVLVIGF